MEPLGLVEICIKRKGYCRAFYFVEVHSLSEKLAGHLLLDDFKEKSRYLDVTIVCNSKSDKIVHCYADVGLDRDNMLLEYNLNKNTEKYLSFSNKPRKIVIG